MVNSATNPPTLRRLVVSIIGAAKANKYEVVEIVAISVHQKLALRRTDSMDIVLSREDCLKEATMLAIAIALIIECVDDNFISAEDQKMSSEFIDGWLEQMLPQFDYSVTPDTLAPLPITT